LACAVGVGCASGDGARQADAGTDSESLGSGEVTVDTIDPTMFSTSLSTDASNSGTTAASSGDETASDSAGDTAPATTGGEGPTVVEVTPDAIAGVDPDTLITVSFSAAMDPRTISADGGGCTGAIQLSSDDFASCVALGPAVTAADGDTTFSVTPASTLGSALDYRVRVTTSATAADGTPLSAESTSEGFVSRYHHTVAIDGVDDWNGDEGLTTSTVGHVAHVAWDAEYVYLGMRSPDVAIVNGAVWVVFYLGGPNGTSDGVLYNTQAPALPFSARWHVRWRADNIFTDVLEYDGAQWAPGGLAFGDGDVYQQGELLELRIARSDLGDPDGLELHAGLLRETVLDEASWAACPEDSYADGYDPDYSQYWSFDLNGSVNPAEHVPAP
jgi:Bacterial Ig-like domain